MVGNTHVSAQARDERPHHQDAASIRAQAAWESGIGGLDDLGALRPALPVGRGDVESGPHDLPPTIQVSVPRLPIGGPTTVECSYGFNAPGGGSTPVCSAVIQSKYRSNPVGVQTSR